MVYTKDQSNAIVFVDTVDMKIKARNALCLSTLSTLVFVALT